MNLFLKKKYRGGILVEFAIAIPLLVTILLFAIDATKYFHWKRKIKNATYFTASMMQTLIKLRPAPISDINRSICQAIHNFTNPPHPAIALEISTILVEGSNNNTSQHIFGISSCGFQGRINRSTVLPENAIKIPPDLKIKPGEIKIICYLSSLCPLEESKNGFGFFLMTPQSSIRSLLYSNILCFFQSHLTFIPNHALIIN